MAGHLAHEHDVARRQAHGLRGVGGPQMRLAGDDRVYRDPRTDGELDAPSAVRRRVRERSAPGPRALQQIRQHVHDAGRSHMDPRDRNMDRDVRTR
jgi:hypothetical protein